MLTALVYSRGVVRNSALASDLSLGPVRNLAVNATTQRVPESAADFVVSSSDVTTMSVRALIATPAVCMVVWALVAIRAWAVCSVPVSGARLALDRDEPGRHIGGDADDHDLNKDVASCGAGGGVVVLVAVMCRVGLGPHPSDCLPPEASGWHGPPVVAQSTSTINAVNRALGGRVAAVVGLPTRCGELQGNRGMVFTRLLGLVRF